VPATSPRADSEHRRLLEGHGVGGEGLERLVLYLDLLAEWNQKVNLTGARTARERVERLVVPVLGSVDHVRAGLLVDVGSGNGSPGLVIAALRTDVAVTLLEPRLKRWAFLREATRLWPAPRPTALRSRHDEYEGCAGTVTMRALALTPDELRHLVCPGGVLMIFGRPCRTGAGWLEVGRGEELCILRRTNVPRETPP
jgi:16S rRNA (guanine527-N7)-methyltransferase